MEKTNLYEPIGKPKTNIIQKKFNSKESQFKTNSNKDKVESTLKENIRKYNLKKKQSKLKKWKEITI